MATYSDGRKAVIGDIVLAPCYARQLIGVVIEVIETRHLNANIVSSMAIHEGLGAYPYPISMNTVTISECQLLHRSRPDLAPPDVRLVTDDSDD